MKQHESSFSIQFRHWLMSNREDAKSMIDCSLEMKDTRGKDRFYLREVKEAQVEYGKSVKWSKKGVLIRTEGYEGLADYHFIKQKPAYVVIKFPKGFCIIDIETIELEQTKAKSITWERAQELSVKVIK